MRVFFAFLVFSTVLTFCVVALAEITVMPEPEPLRLDSHSPNFV